MTIPALLLVAIVGCDCSKVDIIGTPDGYDDVGLGCGNGIVETGEECDDGDDDDCNGCTSMCTWERALQMASSSPSAEVAVADIPCITCPFTIEMWLRLDSEDSSATLLDIPGWLVWGASTEIFSFDDIYGTGGMLVAWPEPVTPGEWHHVALNCKLMDGSWMMWPVADGYTDMGGLGDSERPEPTCVDPMLFGPRTRVVGVTVDDVRISSEAMYPRRDSYTPERYLSVTSSTVAFWNFNHIDDGVIIDVSGNGHDVVLVDGTLVADDCHVP